MPSGQAEHESVKQMKGCEVPLFPTSAKIHQANSPPEVGFLPGFSVPDVQPGVLLEEQKQ